MISTRHLKVYLAASLVLLLTLVSFTPAWNAGLAETFSFVTRKTETGTLKHSHRKLTIRYHPKRHKNDAETSEATDFLEEALRREEMTKVSRLKALLSLRRSPPLFRDNVDASDSSNVIINNGSSTIAADFPSASIRTPLLTEKELLTLQYFARGSMYVEWGSGASTTLAAPLARRAISIENQRTWCDEMMASSDVDFWIRNGVLTFICVDTGPTGTFGTPTAEADPAHFSRYLSALDDAAAVISSVSSSPSSSASSSALSFPSFSSPTLQSPSSSSTAEKNSSSTSLSLTEPSPDSAEKHSSASPDSVDDKDVGEPLFHSSNTFTTVLVDGRFRVACALKALWHIDHSRGVLLVHDWTGRQEYHAPILKRYDLLTVVDRLAVLVPSTVGMLSNGASDAEVAENELRRLRWWTEAAEELERYYRESDRRLL